MFAKVVGRDRQAHGSATTRARTVREVAEFYLKTREHVPKKDPDAQCVYGHPLIDTRYAISLASFFLSNWSRFKRSYSLLNIGIGMDVPPNWLTFFRDVLQYDTIGSLEIWKPYIMRWQFHEEFPVWQGDVKDFDKLTSPKSVDTVLWAHGPEHLSLQEIAPTYLKIKRAARHHILFVTPWGSAYDRQEDHNRNPFERHLVKNPSPEIYKETKLSTLVWGIRSAPSAGMLAYEFLLEESEASDLMGRLKSGGRPSRQS
jgi:hypothetical protein